MGANQRARNACIWAEMRVYSRDGQLALLLNLVDAQWTSPFRRPDRSRERSSVEDRPGLACTTASTKAACHDGRKHPGCRVGASRAKSGERPSAGRWTAVCWSVWPGRLGGAACHGRSTLPLWLRCGYGPTATPDVLVSAGSAPRLVPVTVPAGESIAKLSSNVPETLPEASRVVLTVPLTANVPG